MRINRIILMTAVFLLPTFVMAAGLVPCGGHTEPECNFCFLMQLAQNIVNFVIMASASVGAIMFAYAGVLYLTNGGDTNKVTKAHGIFSSVFFGVIIILVSWLVVDVLIKSLAKESFGPWNKIECSSSRTGVISG